MTEPTDEERQRMEAEADAEADRQLDAVRDALNSALEGLSGEGVHPVTIVQALIVLAVQLAGSNDRSSTPLVPPVFTRSYQSRHR